MPGDEHCPTCGEKLTWKKEYLKTMEQEKAKDKKIEKLSARQKIFLEKEIVKWEEKNLLSKSQAINILEEYGLE
jgi:hypothetical protein